MTQNARDFAPILMLVTQFWNGCKIVVHNITKDLEMFMLVTNCRIKIHHEEINLTNFYDCGKITNKDILSLSKFDQNIEYLQQWQQTKQG
jgi:hypothetical protein